jgi:hypothetical protein
MNMRRFILLDKEGRVITDAQHLEEAKYKLESYLNAYAIYDSKRGYVRMLKLEEAIHER